MKPISEFLKDIQETEITWIATKDDPTVFEAIFGGEHVQLRMNDFPDEPIYTLFVRDEAIDIDEGPRIWHLQHDK
jgi:hypothetical protein